MRRPIAAGSLEPDHELEWLWRERTPAVGAVRQALEPGDHKAGRFQDLRRQMTDPLECVPPCTRVDMEVDSQQAAVVVGRTGAWRRPGGRVGELLAYPLAGL